MLTTLPGRDYWDPAIFAIERERIFHAGWFYAGRADRVAEAGQFVTVDVAGESILLVRGRDGGLRGFYNVCRHRGSPLCDEERGQVKGAIKCPYHAWAYGLDGALIGTPNVRPEEIDRATTGLWPVRCEVWEGFAFVSLATGVEPLADWLEAQPYPPTQFARFGMGELVTGYRTVTRVAANWKGLIENYGECLHCPTVHPELVAVIPAYRNGAVAEAAGDGGVAFADGGTTYSLTGRTKLPLLPGLSERDRTAYFGCSVFPNMFLDTTGNCVISTVLLPHAADATTVVTEYLFRPETVAAADFDPSEIVDFTELVSRQDFDVCERVQRGVSSRAYAHGVYAEKDRGLREFNDYYLERRGPV